MQASAASPTTSTYAGRQLPLATLLHLATLGGAQVCGLEDRIGSFAPGKALDEGLHVKPAESKELEVWLERFLFTGDDRNIKRVYVQGRSVGGTETIQ
jgi:guanine deaminase